MAIFEHNYTVNISNVNSEAKITNLGMLSILEDVACRHSDTAGIGIKDIPVIHLSWMLLAWKVKILKRVYYGTKLRACTWARPINRFNTYRDFAVYDENGEVVCIATSKWTLVDTQKGAITKITDDIIEKYEPEPKNVFENPDIDKLVEPASFSNEYIYRTERRDIDVNKHMHNLNYLGVAYEALPEDVYFSPECNNIEIMYKRGIKLGDTIKCLYENENDAHYITMRNADNNALNAIVKLY